MGRNALAQSAIPIILPVTDPAISRVVSPAVIPLYTWPAYTRPMYSDSRRQALSD